MEDIDLAASMVNLKKVRMKMNERQKKKKKSISNRGNYKILTSEFHMQALFVRNSVSCSIVGILCYNSSYKGYIY